MLSAEVGLKCKTPPRIELIQSFCMEDFNLLFGIFQTHLWNHVLYHKSTLIIEFDDTLPNITRGDSCDILTFEKRIKSNGNNSRHANLSSVEGIPMSARQGP